MPYGPELDRLAKRFAEQPNSTWFAPLAEALRKQGILDDAMMIAGAGAASRPDYLPGHLVLARVCIDQKLWAEAEAALQHALSLDADHPVVVATLRQIAAHLVSESEASAGILDPPAAGPVAANADVPASVDAVVEAEDEPADMVYMDEIGESEATDLPRSAADESVLTESLAMLYRGQGHLDQAVDVLDALVARNPGNADLVARRDAVRAELQATHPRPYDAQRSGGRPIRAWLSSLATTPARAPIPASSFDAFYQTSPVPPSQESDLAAFQAWLKELDR